MLKKTSKKEVEKHISEFFSNINDRTPKEVKKTRRLAMKFKIPLKEKRKLFCKKCFNPYKTPKTRIKNKIKSVLCENCGSISKWRIKN